MKSKRFDDLLSCERRGWKEDCEKAEMVVVCMKVVPVVVDPNKRLVKDVLKILMVVIDTPLAECNSDPSKMCRWGPDEENSTDKRKPGCYTNKGFQDSYLNTIDNTLDHLILLILSVTRTGEDIQTL